MTVTMELQAKVPWRFYRDRASGRYIATCDPLNLVLEAEDYTDLAGMVAEGLDLLFRDLLETNDLEDFLRTHGWAFVEPLPPGTRDARFVVPFELLAREAARGHQVAVHQ